MPAAPTTFAPLPSERHAPATEDDWRRELAPYARSHAGRAAVAVANSLLPYLVLSVAIYFAMRVSVLLALALAVPTAAFLVRTFIIFHDCTHGSFLRTKRANARLGAALGLLVFAPFARWKHDHAVHHATAGDLDRRGVGDVLTLTVREYEERSPRGRLAYRLLRNPLIMFGLGPIAAMLIGPRIVSRDARPRMRRSVVRTDFALLVLIGALCWLIGWEAYLIVCLVPAMLAGSAGIWLFYVQHQFEDAYWESSDSWSYSAAALRGSSFLRLPGLLRFCSGNIGYHHVHHLDSRVPSYNLPRAHEQLDVFRDVPALSGRRCDPLGRVEAVGRAQRQARLVPRCAASLRPLAGQRRCWRAV